jgi:SAM-dependent MidA family methyltransferase
VNKEEMLEMKAGKELDALVIEKVMRWKNDGEWLTDITTFPGLRLVEDFKPSTDMTAAWEVLEEMQSEGIYLDIRTYADFYMVEVRKESGHLLDACAQGLTAPYAICIAALKVVMDS